MDKTVGILGGGQLGRMMVEAAHQLNINVKVLDAEGCPASQVLGRSNANHIGSFKDRNAILKLAKECDVITAEIEHIDVRPLREIAEGQVPDLARKVEVQPSWETFEVIQDKFLQKEHLQRGGLPVARSLALPDKVLDHPEKTLNFLFDQSFSLPVLLKARCDAYDGRGNYPVRLEKDLPQALAALASARKGGLYVEEWVNFEKELAVMVVKTQDAVLSYPIVETVQEDSICKLVYAPAPGIKREDADRARKLAEKAVGTLKGKGVFGVEMFLKKWPFYKEGENIIINEIAPRTHNSGHYTQDACQLNQFAAHLSAIVDLPINPTWLNMTPRATLMLNLLGTADPADFTRIVRVAREITPLVHLYGKAEARPGRKMGHVNVIAPTMQEAISLIAPLIRAVNFVKLKQSGDTTSVPSSPSSTRQIQQQQQQRSSSSSPLVEIVTGSISDQPKLEACYKTLQQLQIPYWKGIKSAHRTPNEMAQYAREAKSRGVKVIIAAAGGAAHLPGMVAAFAGTVPVIGLPIKPTIGDGFDSLVSCTNMPEGVPVLTVGVNRAKNAALSAAMVLAGWDETLSRRLEQFLDEQTQASLETDKALQAEES